MLTVAGGIKGRPGQHVGEVDQLQQGGQGFLPTCRLSPEGCLCGAAVGAAQGVGRRHQLAEAAAADVLTADHPPAGDPVAACVVELAGPPLPSHLCYLSVRAPLCLSTRQASILLSPENWNGFQATTTFCRPFCRAGPFTEWLKGWALGTGSGRPGSGSSAAGTVGVLPSVV